MSTAFARASGLAAFTLASTLFSASAAATLPADRQFEYHIRQTPSDPLSAVIFTVRLELHAADQDASTIGWEITQAQFEQFTAQGELVARWSIERPTVDSIDGLWWVEHEHVEEPAIAEFTTPPTVAGVAPRATGVGPDLEFSITAGSLSSQYQSYYGGAVSALTHSFVEEDDDVPITTGENDPVEGAWSE